MRNKKALAAIGLVVVLAIGGSFAYFSQTTTTDNQFNTGTYGSTTTEEFNPADGSDWKPGSEVEKKVGVKNTGDQPIVVRVKFNEAWSRGTDNFKEIGPVDIALTGQDNAKDGQTAEDDSVVAKTLNTTDWAYNAADGYYYFKTVLGANDKAADILSKVQLLADVDMGNLATTYSYTLVKADGTESTGTITADEYKNLKATAEKLGVVKGDKFTTTADTAAAEGQKGYSGANYNLVITTETVQATDVAVADAFKSGATFYPTLNWDLATEKLPTE